MSEYLMKLDGSDGQIYLYNDRVSITRSGIWAMISHGMKPAKDVILQNIVSIDLQQAGFLGQGSITINCLGESDKKDFTLKFAKKNNQDFVNFKEQVIEIINNK